MNIHHLELFYYVATYGGISRAVRHMPYGIQQPAVSGQILQLEEDLGVKLFERTPFKLTHAGDELYRAIKPFFENLDTLAARISKKNIPRLRIGAAEIVLAEYLPPILRLLRKHQPNFRIGLRAMGSRDIEALFAQRDIDVAISALDRRIPARLQRELLISLPLGLLVPKSSKWSAPDDLRESALLDEPLICLPTEERICWLFHEELKRRRLDWPVSIEASSLALMTTYVENGYGIGITVSSPRLFAGRKVRVIPLPEFPAFELYAIWNANPEPLVTAFLDEVRTYVRQEWK
jgi:DNA-binding transcriptional LysR family regulator